MSAMRYLTALGVYAIVVLFIYGKREAVPREFFTKKEGDLYKLISAKKREKGQKELNFTEILAKKGGVAKAKAEVAKDK